MVVLLTLGTLGALAGCQDGSEEDLPAGSDSAAEAPVKTVQAPPSLGTPPHCRNVASGDRFATSDGVIAGPFDSLAGAARRTGVAKLWVAPATKPSKREDALIQVKMADGPVQADPAVYVRRSQDMVKVTPAPANSVDKIYNGTIILPSAPGTTIRITVTIGAATGCFLTRL